MSQSVDSHPRPVDSWHLSLSGDQPQPIESQLISVCRQPVEAYRQPQVFSVYELFSYWNSKEVSESLLLEAVDWMVKMILLKI